MVTFFDTLVVTAYEGVADLGSTFSTNYNDVTFDMPMEIATNFPLSLYFFKSQAQYNVQRCKRYSFHHKNPTHAVWQKHNDMQRQLHAMKIQLLQLYNPINRCTDSSC